MIIPFRSKKSAQREWRKKTIEYAEAVNAYVKRGLREGWQHAGPEPKDAGREQLVPHLLKAIRQANETGDLQKLREEWPLAQEPLIPLLEKNGQNIPTLAILDDGRIVARIGAPYERGYVVEIRDLTINRVSGIVNFGRSPDRKYFAYSTDGGIRITAGWLGSQTAFCPYPTGTEGVPSEFRVEPLNSPPIPTKLVPFPDGKRVLFVSPEGIFVLSETKAIRLLPSVEDMREYFQWNQANQPSDDLRIDLAMEHGTVSPDGKHIAVGCQDSLHYVFNDNYEIVGKIGHGSEYPHYALFSNDGDMIAFNSCHFYNGITIGVPTNLLPGLETEPYEDNESTPILEDCSRVYAGVYRKDEFIIGDAAGYLRAFGKDGSPHWQHFIGSSVGDIDISSDESLLVCSTYAGFISVIQLDRGASESYEIGNGGHTETRRWLFWKGENRPLAW